MKGIIVSFDEINSYIDPEIDLFIGAISEEDRCPIGFKKLLERKIVIKNKLIFYFNEILDFKVKTPPGNAEVEDRPKKIEKFDKYFNILNESEKLFVSLADEVEGIKYFRTQFNKIFPNPDKIKIAIDFSVMVKPYYFLLLRYLYEYIKPQRIFLIYTEPASYNQKLPFFSNKTRNTFTKGRIDTCEIPTFSGQNYLSKTTALIILLGFEGQRATEIVNSISQQMIIPVNGFPSYRPEFKDISILSNDDLFKEESTFDALQYAPSHDPFETYNVLKTILMKHQDKNNIAIAPLGTKPMALGACFLGLEFRECRIVYPYPLEYIIKSSTGFGNSWIYIVEFFDNRT